MHLEGLASRVFVSWTDILVPVFLSIIEIRLNDFADLDLLHRLCHGLSVREIVYKHRPALYLFIVEWFTDLSCFFEGGQLE